jgi:6-pyruvoyltetrahydropterin/6-carboxytetrahydropterin synthase
MVIDFAELDRSLGTWIQDHLDHTMLIDKDDQDPASLELRALNRRLGKPVFDTDGPPTAETISVLILRVAFKTYADSALRVLKVQVWETARSHATSIADQVIS